MKAMIGWQNIRGYKVRSLIRTIDTRNANLSAKLVRVFTGPRYNGYIFKLQNLSSRKSYFIDLKDLKLGMPSLALLGQIDRAKLGPQGKGTNTTFLRIVAKPTSVYYNINLPVGPIQKSSSQY